MQKVFIAPAQFLGVGVGLGAGLAVVGNGFRLQIVQRGISHRGAVKAFLLAALVKDCQVVIGAMLICAADTAQGPFGQALGFEENGFFLWLRFRHMHHQHRFANDGFGTDRHAYRLVKDTAALGGDVCAQFFRLLNTLDFIGREQGHFFAHHAQQQPAAAQARFVGKGANGF